MNTNTNVIITPELSKAVALFLAEGKTPWLVIASGSVTSVYASRTAARQAKAGSVAKFGDVHVAPASPVAGTPVDSEAPAKAAKAAPLPVTRESTIVRPCKQVWHIADAMLEELGPTMKRKDVMKAAIEAGVAYYTARTQYQQWLGVRREMAEREVAMALKAAKAAK